MSSLNPDGARNPPLLRALGCSIAIAMAASSVTAAIAPAAPPAPGRVDPALSVLRADDRMVELLIAVPEPGSSARPAGIFAQTAIVDGKREAFEASAHDIVGWLQLRGYSYREYWIASSIWARVPAHEIATLAARTDVRFLAGNPVVKGIEPVDVEAAQPKAVSAIEWGIDRIRAPQSWAAGYAGQGAVVAGEDTGYQWDHPALKRQYRGWNPETETATHDYNWHDAIHTLVGGGSNSCGLDAAAPCDDQGHGTHTMGTMVGDDGAGNQIGVAPQARWIGCRNMERGNGTPATYLECMQFFAAPTDAQGNNPRADLAPNVINNSWGCPASEGCSAQTDVLMATAIRNLLDLGILFVVSAGNAGSSCNTVQDPPATLELSFTVGSTTIAANDAISGFSSRGPVGGRLAPSIAAPGSSIRSSIRGNGYGSLSGTSMAGPHVAGAAALLISRRSWLANYPDRVRALLEQNAAPRTSTQTCGSFDGAVIPNAVFGHGRLDAKAAVDAAGEWILLDGFDGR